MRQLLAARRPSAEGQSHAGTLAAMRVRATTLALWGLVGLGALTGTLSLLLRVAAAPAAPKLVAAQPSAVGPAGFAELFVATYLSEAGGDVNDVLRPFYAGAVDLQDVTPGALYVSGTVALDAKQLSRGYWSVTVGARILGAAAGTYRSGGMRAYQVGVASTTSGYAATSLPRPGAPSGPGLHASAPGLPALAAHTRSHHRRPSALLRRVPGRRWRGGALREPRQRDPGREPGAVRVHRRARRGHRQRAHGGPLERARRGRGYRPRRAPPGPAVLPHPGPAGRALGGQPPAVGGAFGQPPATGDGPSYDLGIP